MIMWCDYNKLIHSKYEYLFIYIILFYFILFYRI